MEPKRIFISALAIALATAGPRGVGAEPDPVPRDFGEAATDSEAEVIVIEGELVTPVSRTRALSVVDPDDRIGPPPAVVADLLRETPGVFVQATGPGQGAPILRGLIGSGILMTVDGVRVNNAFFRPAPNQYFSLVDPFNVDSMEVLRGAGSVTYGSDAMGGVINVVTREPRFDSEDWVVTGRSIGGVGSADRSAVGRLAVAGGRRGFGASVGITGQRHGDLRTGTGVVGPTGYSSNAFDARVVVARGGHDLTLAFDQVEIPSLQRYDELAPGYGQDQPSAAVWAYEPNSRTAARARYRVAAPFWGIDQLEIGASFARIDDARRTRDMGSDSETREHNRGDTAGLVVRTQFRAGEVDLQSGVQLYHDLVRCDRNQVDIVTGQRDPARCRFPDGSRMTSAGAYLEAAIPLSRRWLIELGARASAFDLRIPAADRDVGVDLLIPDLTGHAGARFQVTRELAMIANVGRGFRAPNVYDLANLGERPGGRYQVPGGALGPESMWSLDSGVEIGRGRVRGQLVGWVGLYRDQIEAVPTGEMTVEGRAIVESVNLGRVDLTGVEAAVEVDLAPALIASATLGYTRGTEHLDGGTTAPASRIPPLHFRAHLGYVPSANLVVGVDVAAAASQQRLSERDLDDPRIDPTGTDGWVVFGLRGAWRASERTRFTLALDNVLDATYREHASGVDAAGLNASVAVETTF